MLFITCVLIMPLGLLLESSSAAAVTTSSASRGLRDGQESWGYGRASSRDDTDGGLSSSEDSGWVPDEYSLNKKLTEALRNCIHSYNEDQGRSQTNTTSTTTTTSTDGGSRGAGGTTGESFRGSAGSPRELCLQSTGGARRRRGVPGRRHLHRVNRDDRYATRFGYMSSSPRPGRRTWVTYYGRHIPPSLMSGGPKRRDQQGDVMACTIHCAFAKTQLVTSEGLPDESLVVKSIEDSDLEPKDRLAAMRNARDCFARLGSAIGVDDDQCFYTMKLAKCMDMDIFKEFHKMKSNSSF